MKYLSYEGLVYFYAKVKALIKNESVQKTGGTITGSLEVTEQLKTPWIQHGQKVGASLGSVKFTTGTANEKFKVIFGKKLLRGWFAIELSSDWSHTNAAGRMCKRFNLIADSTGVINYMQTYYESADTQISTYYAIGNMEWDATDGWYVVIGKTHTSAAEYVNVNIHANGGAVPDRDMTKLTDIYTTDATALDSSVLQIPINTVMRSGTVDYPIAAIAEEGSNANGNYIRFTNGLQICWLRHVATYVFTTAIGNLFRGSSLVTWTYPAAFLSKPSVTGTLGGGASFTTAFLASLASNDITNCQINPISVTSTNAELALNLIAIGRWK